MQVDLHNDRKMVVVVCVFFSFSPHLYVFVLAETTLFLCCSIIIISCLFIKNKVNNATCT